MGLEAGRDGRPNELNFASFGTLQVQFPSGATRTCSDMRIGQGHHGLRNNWWIASKNCFKPSDGQTSAGDRFVCRACGLSIQATNSEDTFEFREEGPDGDDLDYPDTCDIGNAQVYFGCGPFQAVQHAFVTGVEEAILNRSERSSVTYGCP